MKELVSIIVPVYNAERYLSRCIESILAQSYELFELLLIDDGSRDQSGELCDEYAIKDARIRVIHQENQGAAAARNAGLDAVRGQYVIFCDSDDLVSPMWVERLVALAGGDRFIQPLGAYCAEMQDLGLPRDLPIAARKIYDLSAYYAFNEAGLAGYLCNALYRTDIIRERGLRIRSRRDEGDYNEDLIFALEYAEHMEGFVYSGFADYLYDRRDGSLSTSYQQYYFVKYEEKYRLWRTFIGKHVHSDNEKRLATVMLYHFLRSMQMECDRFSVVSMREVYQRFKQIVLSKSVQTCVRVADASKENPRVIRLIQKKKALRLWMIYILNRMKRNKR